MSCGLRNVQLVWSAELAIEYCYVQCTEPMVLELEHSSWVSCERAACNLARSGGWRSLFGARDPLLLMTPAPCAVRGRPHERDLPDR